MPITFDIKPDKSLVVAVHDGVVPDEEFVSAYKLLLENDRFDDSYNLLVDLRRADSSARGTDALKGFAEFMRNQYANVGTRPKIAVVAPENISFGLARMYEAFSDSVPMDFMVFRELSGALNWLGLDGDLLDDHGSTS